MAQQIGQVLKMERPATVSPLPYDKQQIDRMLETGLTTQAECGRLRSLALALPSECSSATNDDIVRHLEWIAATLPAKNIDMESGQKRVVVYARILSGYSNDSLSYMVKRACSELNWFPTPKQCLDILAEYNPPVTRKDRALRLCEMWTQEQFDQFVNDLRDGPIPQAEIDAKLERWKRICVETGLLRREGDGYVQRVKISAE